MTRSEVKKIAVITTTRADYSLLHPICIEINKNNKLQLQLIATGTHFSSLHGNTYKEIENDGLEINFKGVINALHSANIQDITNNLSQYCTIFSKAIEQLRPDILIVLGDRYEILTAAQIGLLFSIPICHLCGGDITEGANDNLFRNAISQISQIHCTTNSQSTDNLIKMGIHKNTIHTVGSPGIDNIINTISVPKDIFFKKIEFIPQKKNILFTMHPITKTKYSSSIDQIITILMALKNLNDFHNIGIIFTSANSDLDGDKMNEIIKEFCYSNTLNCKFYNNLGRENYINAIRNVDIVMGNSSSLLYEVPALRKPSINIGDRQEGRLSSNSVLTVVPEIIPIQEAIYTAFKMNCEDCVSPYGNGMAAKKIIDILENI